MWPTTGRMLAKSVLAGVTLGLATLSACAPKPQPDPMTADWGTVDQPPVVSGSPQADTMAFRSAQQSLGETQFQEQHRRGPAPIWDPFNKEHADGPAHPEDPEPARRRGASRNQNESPDQPQASNPHPPEGDAPDAGADADDAADAPDAAELAAEGNDPDQTDEEAHNPDQPADVEDAGQTTLIPRGPEPVPNGVTIHQLPDDRIRMVYPLRHYGGTTVSSSRDGGTSRREVKTAAADLDPLAKVVNQHLGDNGSATPLPRENTLVITCPADQQDAVLELLGTLDIAPRQVEITAKIFEVSHDFDFQYGAQVIAERIAANDTQSGVSTFQAQRALDSLAGQRSFQGGVLSLMRVFEDAGVSLEGTFQILQDEGLIRVVSSPRMTVHVGQTGYMLAGQELPIQSATIRDASIHTQTSYKPVGVQLYITPQAMGPDSVKLHVVTVVSTVSGFAPLPTLLGNLDNSRLLINPIIEAREAETAVTIDDGHTLVISGLRMYRTITREEKIPGLGDLPLIGWLFKNHRSQRQMTDLYFFVTPTML